MSFNGSSQLINFGNSLNSDVFTLEAIIYPTATPAAFAYIISKAQYGNGVEYQLTLTSANKIGFACYNSSQSSILSMTSSSTVSLNTYTHIVVSIPAGSASAYMYINGIQDTSGSKTGVMGTQTFNINFAACDACPSGRWFTGILDEIRISNINRSAAYVKASYYSCFDNLITYSLQFHGGLYISNDIYDCFSTYYFINAITDNLSRYSANAIVDGLNRYSKCPMTEDYTRYAVNEITDGKLLRHVSINSISNGFNKRLYISNSLDSFNTIRRYSIDSSADQPTAKPTYNFDITIDGVSVRNLVNSVKINIAESNFTNQVSISFLNLDMYNQCDPQINYGTERIIVTIEGNIYKFIIETRNRSEEFTNYKFTLTGRQITLFLGAGYAQPTDNIIENHMASTIASTLGGSLVNVNWSAMDYFIPDFTYIGFPIDGIKILADGTGAIMRTTADGQLVIRRKFDIRPQDLSGSVPPFIFTDNEILRREINEQKATYNAVEVMSTGNSADNLELVPMDTCITTGAVSEIKVYTGRSIDYKINISSGTLSKMSTGNIETLQEQIVIINGKGSTSRRIMGVNSYEFIHCPDANAPVGSPLGLLTNPTDGLKYPFWWEKGSQDILLAGTGNTPGIYTGQNTPIQEGILIINYNTVYDLWTVTNNTAGEILLVADMADQGIDTVVITGDGNYLASPIHHPYIGTQGQAVEIGRASLDETSTKKYTYKITVPYCNAFDGQLAMVDNKKGYIKQADINLEVKGNSAVIMQDIEVAMYGQ
ncbi:MAG: LamG domain-containing protein [Nitrospirae bacterium]|nr:LamG domain-containing protein [Nitrospirota bacterium]